MLHNRKSSTNRQMSAEGGLPFLYAKQTNASASSTASRNRPTRKQPLCTSVGRVLSLVLIVATIVVLFCLGNAHSSSKHPHYRLQNQRIVLSTDDNRRASSGLYDVCIAGTGPAGLTAGLFAARAGLSVLVTGSDTGQLSETASLDNFPSWNDGHGENWLKTTKQQAAAAGVDFAQAGLLVTSMTMSDDGLFLLDLSPSLTVTSRSVIVATGATGRRLGLEHEDELWGKSIHSCAICDGTAYVDKTVVVLGGGDSAMDAALLLSRHATKVVVVHRNTEFRASNKRNVEQLLAAPNIQTQTPFIVERYEVSEKKELIAVHVKQVDGEETDRIPCDGVFLMIGSTPNTGWLSQTLQLDSKGLIVLKANDDDDAVTATSVNGVFAAGEVTDKTYKQAITGAAAGAQAAIDAERWLRTQPQIEGHIVNTIPLQKIERVGRKATISQPQKVVSRYNCDLAVAECITSVVKKYPVVVFSKPWCPYCRKALEALSLEGVKGEPYLHVVDLSEMVNRMTMIQATLGTMTGRRTVPNVFIGGKSIGGGDETTALHRDGKLRALLLDAKALPPEKHDVNCDLSTEECITSVVNKYPVVVFSKPWCPYCRRVLEVLSLEGVSTEPFLHVIDLTTMGDRGGAIQDRLQQMTGRRTVPNVFVGGKNVGGCDETTGLHQDGKLKPLLGQAKAFG